MENQTSRDVVVGSVGLALGAVCAVTALKWYQSKQNSPLEHTKVKSTERLVRVGPQETVLAEEQFKRNIQFLGEEAFAKLANSKIVIVGLGGTGSHAAHLLARSGAGFLRLIDLDQVSLSSLNRHAVATRIDVGKSKVGVMKEHLLKTVPAIECECIQDIFSKDNGERLLFSRDPLDDNAPLDFVPDFVVDCIDNVSTKAFLLALCKQRDIPIITCCGAGCRLDPTRFTICDISEAAGDPLLRATKVELAKNYKIRKGIPCLFSSEKPPRKLLPFTEEDEDPGDYQTLPEIHMRVRIVPVLGPMPAIWGNVLAQYVINRICEQEFTPQPIESRGRKYWDSLITRIRTTEKQYCKEKGFTNPGVLNKECTAFVVEDLWNFESVLSGRASPAKGGITLVRWDLDLPISITNAIPLTLAEAKEYYAGNITFSDTQKATILRSLAVHE